MSLLEPLKSMHQMPLQILVIFGMASAGEGAGEGGFFLLNGNKGVARACNGIIGGHERISLTDPPKTIVPEALIEGTPREA